MNEMENDPQDAFHATDPVENLDLRRLVNLLFVGLIFTSFTLTAYLGMEARRAWVDLAIIQPRAERAVVMLNEDNASAEGIYMKLADFARTHPDFQNKVLSNYKVATTAPAGAKK